MNIAPLISAPLAVQIHLVAVAAAVAGTTFVMAGKKGTHLHKMSGRLYVFGMVAAALSSFWIMDLNHGRPSFIHAISVMTLLGLGFAVTAARQGQIKRHKMAMISTAIGGLGFAGAFAILAPGRLMWTMLFG